MKLNSTLLRGFAVIALTAGFTMPSIGEEVAQNSDLTKSFTHFKTTPEALISSGPGIYTRTLNTLRSLSGVELVKLGDQLIDADANPYGTNFFLISNKGKKNQAEIVLNNQFASTLFKVN